VGGREKGSDAARNPGKKEGKNATALKTGGGRILLFAHQWREGNQPKGEGEKKPFLGPGVEGGEEKVKLYKKERD